MYLDPQSSERSADEATTDFKIILERNTERLINMQKIQAFLAPDLKVMLRGSSARGAEQWYTVTIDETNLRAELSGSGPYVVFQGPVVAPILPPVGMGNFRSFLISCDIISSGVSSDGEYVHKSACAHLNASMWEINCTVLDDGIELLRQMKFGVARSTKLPIKVAVAVATRRPRRPLSPTPRMKRAPRRRISLRGLMRTAFPIPGQERGE